MIVNSLFDLEDYAERLRSFGVKDYFVKSFLPTEELTAEVKRIIG